MMTVIFLFFSFPFVCLFFSRPYTTKFYAEVIRNHFSFFPFRALVGIFGRYQEWNEFCSLDNKKISPNFTYLNSPVCQPARLITEPASPHKPVGLEEGVEKEELGETLSLLQNFLLMARMDGCCLQLWTCDQRVLPWTGQGTLGMPHPHCGPACGGVSLLGQQAA